MKKLQDLSKKYNLFITYLIKKPCCQNLPDKLNIRMILTMARHWLVNSIFSKKQILFQYLLLSHRLSLTFSPINRCINRLLVNCSLIQQESWFLRSLLPKKTFFKEAQLSQSNLRYNVMHNSLENVTERSYRDQAAMLPKGVI